MSDHANSCHTDVSATSDTPFTPSVRYGRQCDGDTQGSAAELEVKPYEKQVGPVKPSLGGAKLGYRTGPDKTSVNAQYNVWGVEGTTGTDDEQVTLATPSSGIGAEVYTGGKEGYGYKIDTPFGGYGIRTKSPGKTAAKAAILGPALGAEIALEGIYDWLTEPKVRLPRVVDPLAKPAPEPVTHEEGGACYPEETMTRFDPAEVYGDMYGE